jgi:hypothetical protein
MLRIESCVRYLLLGCLIAPSVVAAQARASGRIVDSLTGEPVAGAAVVARNEVGASLARTVSSQDGRFSLEFGSFPASIEVRRIGFVPATSRITGESPLRIVLRRLPADLPPIVTTRAAVCDERSDAAAAFALWEQARASFLSSLIMREQRRLEVKTLSYAYWLRPNGRPEPQQVERTSSSEVPRAFGTMISPDAIAQLGYVADGPDGRTYVGPDEEILLSEEFEKTHCFSLLRRGQEDSLVGIHFGVSRNAATVVQISGTAWMLRDPLEVRRIEFEYVNVEPEVSRNRAGGWVDFRVVQNGISTAYAWAIRGVKAPASARYAPEYVRGEHPVVRIAGAIIDTIAWPGGEWHSHLPSLTGSIGTDNGAPAVAAHVVQLANTPYRTRTDSLGRFAFPKVVAGTYSIRWFRPEFAGFHLEDQNTESVSVSMGQSPDVHLEVESDRVLAERACRVRTDSKAVMADALGRSVILGRVGEGPNAIGGLALRVVIDSRSVVGATQQVVVRTDSLGLFRLCGLAPSVVSIRSAITGEISVRVGADELRYVELLQRRQKKPRR